MGGKMKAMTVSMGEQLLEALQRQIPSAVRVKLVVYEALS
jgi:hypothetical protein